MRTHEIWVVKSEWSSWVSHSYTGTLFPKVKAVLHCGPPRAATPSSSSLWLTTERKLAHLPEASSCTPLRGNQPRSCTVSQEISLAGAYHNLLPVLFPVASHLDLLCFQISSKSKRMTRLKEKAVTKTSRVFFFWTCGVNVSHVPLRVFWFSLSGPSHRHMIFLIPITWEFCTKRVIW